MNDEELYEVMLDKGFSINTINQVLKARQAGYDIYTPDVHISNECLRDFRHFVMDNLEPVFNQGQLREIQLGFIKGIDVLQYADENYSTEEMAILRKLLEHKLDIELVKEYSIKKEDMAIYSKALRNGLTRDDFEKFSVEIINEINYYLKKKIDLRKYLNLGYDIEQSKELADIKEKSGIDISEKINPLYHHSTFIEYVNIMSKFSEYNIEKIFNPNFNKFQLNNLYYIFGAHLTDIDKYIDALSDPTYGINKTRLIEALLEKNTDEKQIKVVQDCKLDDTSYMYLTSYLRMGKVKFDERLFSDKISRDYLSAINYVKNVNMDSFFNLIEQGINPSFVPRMLELENQCISINDYIDKKTSNERFKVYDLCMRFIKQNNLWADEKYLMEFIDSTQKLETLKKCVYRKLDYKKLNFDLYSDQINLILDEYPENLEISFGVTKSKSTLQMKAILEAKTNGIKLDNLLTPNLEQFKYAFILQLEKFNLSHERQIDIKEVMALDCDIKTMGPIISKLISDDLDKNLEAYKIMASINKVEIKNIEQKER